MNKAALIFLILFSGITLYAQDGGEGEQFTFEFVKLPIFYEVTYKITRVNFNSDTSYLIIKLVAGKGKSGNQTFMLDSAGNLICSIKDSLAKRYEHDAASFYCRKLTVDSGLAPLDATILFKEYFNGFQGLCVESGSKSSITNTDGKIHIDIVSDSLNKIISYEIDYLNECWLIKRKHESIRYTEKLKGFEYHKSWQLISFMTGKKAETAFLLCIEKEKSYGHYKRVPIPQFP
ncbi:MAG: hypothetical protein K1X81_04725 [Bacteroidia bacterium]|nr:hypothetical protein [Bacteroidia bacterium]